MDGRGQAITCAKADVLFLPASPQWKWGAIDWINTSDKTETWLTSINSRLKTIIFFLCVLTSYFFYILVLFLYRLTHTPAFCPAQHVLLSPALFTSIACGWVGVCVLPPYFESYWFTNPSVETLSYWLIAFLFAYSATKKKKHHFEQ